MRLSQGTVRESMTVHGFGYALYEPGDRALPNQRLLFEDNFEGGCFRAVVRNMTHGPPLDVTNRSTYFIIGPLVVCLRRRGL